jgi:hypothetical protein
MMSDRNGPVGGATSPLSAPAQDGAAPRAKPHLYLAYSRDENAPPPTPTLAPVDTRGQILAYAALAVSIAAFAAVVLTT